MMTAPDQTNSERATLRQRQWQIVHELRQQGDPTSMRIVELMEKILGEEEEQDQRRAAGTGERGE